MEFIDTTMEMKPVEMEDTLNRLLDELSEYPDEFIKRVNSRVMELKFHKPNAYTIVKADLSDFDIFVVNLKGKVYIAGIAVDSRSYINFDDYQLPAIEIAQLWLN